LQCQYILQPAVPPKKTDPILRESKNSKNLSCLYTHTQHKIPTLRIKDEIKFLYCKKQQLNSQIYHLHLTLANTWNNTWQYIHNTIERTLQREMETKYKKLNTKLSKLTEMQTMTPQQAHTFYPCVVNKSNIPFSETEMTLLKKGLKYNLHTKAVTG